MQPDRDQALSTATLLDAWIPIFTEISLDDIDNLLAVLRHEDVVLPIFDPTAWMRTNDDRQQRLRAYGAFRELRKVLSEISAEAKT
jgi:hypothetical protein